MMKTLKQITLYGILILSTFSCVKYKNLILLNEQKEKYEIHAAKAIEPYKIQKSDVLDINVASTDLASVSIFNKSISAGGSGQISETSLYVNGYVVDDSGMVSMPILGELYVEGKTKYEIRDSIQLRINKYFKYATVDVKMVSFRISIIGEVKQPTTQTYFRDNLNMLEALALSGGFTDLAKRHEVKIVRKINGITEIRTVDFTSENLINDEWFQLMPNDMIYVEPVRMSALRINSSSLTFAISIVSLGLIFLNLVKTN